MVTRDEAVALAAALPNVTEGTTYENRAWKAGEVTGPCVGITRAFPPHYSPGGQIPGNEWFKAGLVPDQRWQIRLGAAWHFGNSAQG